MASASLQTVAFAAPGGEICPPSRGRPIDLVHLTRQTLGDRALEKEILSLFIQQAVSVKERIARATSKERAMMAHGLRGSASGVGAFNVAELAKAIEHDPDDKSLVSRLAASIDDVREFVAAINR